MATTVARADVGRLLEGITASGQTFSAACRRRTALNLRYEPTEQYKGGQLAYAGDRTDLATRQFHTAGRGGIKIELEPVGLLRWMQLTKKSHNESKHWKPKPGGSLAFDPAERGLFHVKGFYTDKTKVADGRIARHGDWRAWAFICLRTVESIKAHGQEYVVID